MREAYEQALNYVENSNFENSIIAEATNQPDPAQLKPDLFVDSASTSVRNDINTKEIDAQREVWIQADAYAGDFCNKLIHCHSSYKAKEVMHDFLKHDWFISIDAKYLFERYLVNRIAEKIDDFSDEPLTELMKRFNWADLNHTLWEEEYGALQTIFEDCQQREFPEAVKSEENSGDYSTLIIAILMVMFAMMVYSKMINNRSDFIDYKQYLNEMQSNIDESLDKAPYSNDFHLLDLAIKKSAEP